MPSTHGAGRAAAPTATVPRFGASVGVTCSMTGNCRIRTVPAQWHFVTLVTNSVLLGRHTCDVPAQ